MTLHPITQGCIAMEYAVLSDEKKMAVSNVVRAESYLVAAMIPSGLLVDWKASPGVSVAAILGLISIGHKEYGEVWLEELTSKLSQTE